MKITKKQLLRLIREALDFQPTAKHLFVLIGVPSTGKSTWTRENVPNAHVISSDATMQKAAADANLTYDDLFAGYPTDEEIASNYVHPEYGPIGDQQLDWKRAKKPKAFQRTNAAEKEADNALKANIAAAATSGKPIVIDMMNISASGRKRQIDKLNLPPDYTKVGVVFQSEGSEDAIHSLSQSRNLLGQITTGERKTIPGFLFHLDVEMPLPGEFDKVIYVDNRGKVKDFDMRNRQQVNLYGTQTSEYDFDDEF